MFLEESPTHYAEAQESEMYQVIKELLYGHLITQAIGPNVLF
jgi:hypothetical protein